MTDQICVQAFSLIHLFQLNCIVLWLNHSLYPFYIQSLIRSFLVCAFVSQLKDTVPYVGERIHNIVDKTEALISPTLPYGHADAGWTERKANQDGAGADARAVRRTIRL